MSSLGLCGNLGPSSHISINEFDDGGRRICAPVVMASPSALGAPPSNQQGMLNAFTTIASLISPAGAAPGTAPATATVPVAEMDTLADAVSSCVNSNGNLSPGTSCERLFAAATPAGGALRRTRFRR